MYTPFSLIQVNEIGNNNNTECCLFAHHSQTLKPLLYECCFFKLEIR